MKKTLITGGCGFIGFAMVERLISLGFEVDVIDNLSIGAESKNVEKLGANLMVMDIRDINELGDLGYDIIYHFAALSRIQPSFQQPSETMNINAYGTKCVCEFALKNNAKLIYAGSSSKHHNPEKSPYAMSKYIGEWWLKFYRQNRGLNAEIVRFYNVYGEGELVDSKMAAVIGLWRKKIRDNEPLPIVGNGEQKRDFTYIEDIINGLQLIGFSNQKHDDAWELGAGENFSLNQVYEMFHSRFGCEKIHIPQQQGNYAETLRINNDALDRLGWRPMYRLPDYIQNLK